MHAKPDLRVFLKWMTTRSGSVITDVIPLQESKGMRSFDLLEKELSLTLSHHANYWTTYSLGDHDFEWCEFDWGRSHVYHFDRGVPLALSLIHI